jgi:hypothetical protein
MGRKLTALGRAIADIDTQIAKLQESKALLLKYASPGTKPEPKPRRRARGEAEGGTADPVAE